MKVRATDNGFFGRYIEAGKVFDVPNGVKGSWFEPFKEPFKGKAKAENEVSQNSGGNDGATGNGNDESLT